MYWVTAQAPLTVTVSVLVKFNPAIVIVEPTVVVAGYSGLTCSIAGSVSAARKSFWAMTT